MSLRSGRRFQKRLGAALRPDGWRRSGEAPVVTMPSAGTFVRPLTNGWVAVLTARVYGRDEIELPSWLAGTHGVVTVEGWATFPAAERLGARLETADPWCGFAVARPFAVAGQEPGYRQFRGPEDDERVVAEIERYARRVLLPAAEYHAGLDAWMAAYAATAPGESSSRAWKVPVMLLAHAHADRALGSLGTARQDPELATDAAFAAFADRVEEFVRSGEALPTDGAALSAMAATRAALVAASPAEAEPETAEPEEETSGWEVLGGLVFVVALVVFLVGKGLRTFDIDVGWGWLPAAAVVAYGVAKIGEHSEELRQRWRDNLGSADRVHEYLERQRAEREHGTRDAAALDPASPDDDRAEPDEDRTEPDEDRAEPDEDAPTGPGRRGD